MSRMARLPLILLFAALPLAACGGDAEGAERTPPVVETPAVTGNETTDAKAAGDPAVATERATLVLARTP